MEMELSSPFKNKKIKYNEMEDNAKPSYKNNPPSNGKENYFFPSMMKLRNDSFEKDSNFYSTKNPINFNPKDFYSNSKNNIDFIKPLQSVNNMIKNNKPIQCK